MKRRTLALQGSTVATWIAPLLGLFLLHCEEAAPPPHTTPPPPAPVARASPEASAPTVESRVDDLVARMTSDEKIDYLGGLNSFFIRGIPRLGIPEIKMSDGPAGCRNWGPSTAYVAPVGLAATFDEKLAARVGASMGRDCRARGVHILLGPGMNIHRSPLGGRNFEYLGEDPFLAGKTAAALIRGVQGEGVLATAKHFAGNNQEWDRNHVSSEIDQRTLREIYLPAFERSVREGHVGAVMTAYNLLNGTYCSHSKYLIRDVLERDWAFAGFVMSDWSAVHDTLGAIEGGLDLEMPEGQYLNRETLTPLISGGRVPKEAIDTRVRRILLTLARAGFLDRPQETKDVPLDDPKSAAIALEEARRSLVLLKNAGELLPLDRSRIKRIAVIGPNAEPAIVGGSGSAYVNPFHAVGLLAGVKQAAPSAVVSYHVGVQQASEYAVLGRPVFEGPLEQTVYLGRELQGAPISTTHVDRIDYRPEEDSRTPPVPEAPSENFSIRWRGEVRVKAAATYRLVTNSDDGVRVFVDDKKLIEDWTSHPTKTQAATLPLAPGKHKVVVEYFQGTGGAVAQFGMGPVIRTEALQGGEEVTALAKGADVVVVALGFDQSADTNSVGAGFPGFWPPAWARQKGLVEAEDSDRPFDLPAAEMETVKLAAAANPRTIVVVDAGGAVDMQKFVDKVPALLWAWYPGQEGGRAISEVLFGDTNPSGKLPVTFARRYEDYPSAPYYPLNQSGKSPYTEGVFVGYRGFEANRVEPLFPFGYGLSYTRFEYEKLAPMPRPDGSVSVGLLVKNAGARDGEEVVEVYVAPPKEAVPRPPKELKGYLRVPLSAGKSSEVVISLEPRAFAYWDEHATPPGWRVEAGKYEVLVGASSTDIRLRGTVDLPARMLPP
jgi:beta-glucosidase